MDINISANTLFHFTSSKEALINILKSGLYVRYGLENYENLIEGNAEIAIPMTCFCDIPLSQIKRHTYLYGQYAIGLTKTWGMANKINPVIYTYPGSTTSQILNSLYKDIRYIYDIKEEELPKRKKKVKTDYSESVVDLEKILNFLDEPSFKYKAEVKSKLSELSSNLAHFIKYIKPYQGKFFRNGEYLSKEIKFYEEREWRYTPENSVFNKLLLKNSYKSEYYKDPIKRRAINIKLATHFRLTFQPEDIRFIIVNTDREIPEILSQIEKIFGEKTSYNSLKLLGTRLISLEQILEDL